MWMKEQAYNSGAAKSEAMEQLDATFPLLAV